MSPGSHESPHTRGRPLGDPASNAACKVLIAAVNGAKKGAGTEVSPWTDLQRSPVCVSLSDGLLKAIRALWSESTLQWKHIWSWLRQGEIGLKKFFFKRSELFLPQQLRAADTDETTNQPETNIMLLFFMSGKSQQWKSGKGDGEHILVQRGGRGCGLVSIAYYISVLNKILWLHHMLSITRMLFHHWQQETLVWWIHTIRAGKSSVHRCLCNLRARSHSPLCLKLFLSGVIKASRQYCSTQAQERFF